MGGGLLQLVAYGAQDVYLTGNPQITFFKVVYRRHTNFSIESIQQTFNGNPIFGGRATCQIARNGDLVNKLYLEMTIAAPDDKALFLQPYYGYRIIKHIEIEIGGQRIDKQYGEWMYIWNELSLDRGKLDGYNSMVGGTNKYHARKIDQDKTEQLYIPIEFWFCRNIGLALPLIALQYHEVKVNIEFNPFNDLKANQGDECSDDPTDVVPLEVGEGTLKNVNLWADYIFLDTDERKRFAQLSHEYLIEQLQFTGTEKISANTMKSARLSFNHPCKELVWFVKPDDWASGVIPYWNNFYDGTANQTPDTMENLISKAKLQLNGNDRFAERNGDYFSLVQPYQHHTNIPSNKGINVYSFALKPEEHQPSGTLNMSRIDTAQLQVESKKSGDLYVYAVNYNVLRILSGMGGLAYSN